MLLWHTSMRSDATSLFSCTYREVTTPVLEGSFVAASDAATTATNGGHYFPQGIFWGRVFDYRPDDWPRPRREGLTTAQICVPDFGDKFRNCDGQTDFIFHSEPESRWRYLGIASGSEILSESARCDLLAKIMWSFGEGTFNFLWVGGHDRWN